MNWLKELLEKDNKLELYTDIKAGIEKEFTQYIPKERFNEVNQEKKLYKDQLKEYEEKANLLESQVSALEADKGPLTEQIQLLKQTITENESKFQELTTKHTKELHTVKLNHLINESLTREQAKNPKTIHALLDYSTINLDEHGTLTGLQEQLSKLKETDSYLFETKLQGNSPDYKGSTGYAVTKEQFEKMSYQEKTNLFTTNRELFDYLSQ